MNTKMILIGMLVASLSVSSWAVGFFGTPTAEIGEGRWSVGYDYSYSSQDSKRATLVGPNPMIFNYKDINVHRHYATIGYGLTEDWDIYGKLGLSRLKAKGRQFGGPDAWSDNYGSDFAWGFGTRYTFLRDDTIDWGAAFQMNWLDHDFTDAEGKWEFESYDIMISAGPTVDMGGWNLYAGPFYYYLNAEITGTGDAGVLGKADIRAESNFGGFIGGNFDIADNTTATVEFASTLKGGWGFGAGVAFKF